MKGIKFTIEDWWRHNGAYDRAQASGIKYNKNTNISEFLQKTDDWWNNLTYDEKLLVYEDYFSEC